MKANILYPPQPPQNVAGSMCAAIKEAEKHMIRKARTILALGIGITALADTQVQAKEQSYYKGNSFEIFLNTPDSAQEKAFCAYRSSAWSGKSVAIEYTLIGMDKIVPQLRVIKQNWNLPVGEKTNIAIGTQWFSGAQFDSEAVSGDELYGEAPATVVGDGGSLMVSTILSTAISTKKPAALVVTFQGNEPPWVVPVVSYVDAIRLRTGFDNCIIALTQLGPSLFTAPDISTTSPFAAPSKESNTASPQSQTNGSVMFHGEPPMQAGNGVAATAKWTFEKREEDWGDTCFLETRQENVTIGFMGAPGDDFVAFAENPKYHDVVRASWQVDDKGFYVSDGHANDYFGWHGFYELSPQILDEAKSGKQLRVSDFDGDVITVSLADAAVPIAQFTQCFDKSPTKDYTSSEYPAAPQTSPNRKQCSLEVDGKKAIDGACYWGLYGDDKTTFYMEGNRYFAIINVDGANASGSWNDSPGATHAHAYLGEMKSDGKCWKNKSVSVCPGVE